MTLQRAFELAEVSDNATSRDVIINLRGTHSLTPISLRGDSSQSTRVLIVGDGTAVITRNENATGDPSAPLFTMEEGAVVILDGIILNGEVLVKDGALDLRNTVIGDGSGGSFDSGGSGRRLQRDDAVRTQQLRRWGLRVLGGSSSISGCTFAGLDGGAITVHGGTLAVESCAFRNNRASADGGAILLTGGDLMLSNSSFMDNEANSSGGAIAIRGGSADIATCTFIGNSAGGDGGALHIIGGAVRLYAGTLLADNRAFNGGALSLQFWQVTVDIEEATLRNNTAAAAGGALFVAAGVVRVIDSDIEENTAGSAGGAAFINVGTLMLMDGAAMMGNVAPVGSAASVGVGELRYILPAPLGHWIAAAKTCRLDGPSQPCHSDFDPSATVGRVYSTFSVGVLDENYPLLCAAGTYGTNDSSTQIKSSCAGGARRALQCAPVARRALTYACARASC